MPTKASWSFGRHKCSGLAHELVDTADLGAVRSEQRAIEHTAHRVERLSCGIDAETVQCDQKIAGTGDWCHALRRNTGEESVVARLALAEAALNVERCCHGPRAEVGKEVER